MDPATQYHTRPVSKSARNPVKDPVKEPVKRPVKLGLDFGTAYTAGVVECVRALDGSSEEIELRPFYRYPKNSGLQQGVSNVEIPSIIRYANGGKTIGYQAENEEEEWLATEETPTLRHDVAIVRNIKLAIDDQVEFLQERENVLQSLPNDMTAEAVLEDYLTEVFKSWVEELLFLGFLNGTTYQINCVIPAAWKDSFARLRFTTTISKAAKNAKLNIEPDIPLYSEPVAATAYLLKNDSLFRNDLQKGEVFTVLDAGGGTSDAVTFVVRSKEPLELEEIVPAKGAISGSECLDTRFREHIQERLEDFKHLIENRERSIAMAARTFNTHWKRCFDGLADENRVLHGLPLAGLPADASRSFISGTMQFRTSHMKSIFDPVVSKVWELLEKQIQMALKDGYKLNYVVLVGGFAGSPYLQKTLLEKLTGRSTRLKPLPAHRPCAFAQGAMYYSDGDRGYRISHKHQCSIGLRQDELFNQNKEGHRKADKTVEEATGRIVARNLINFFIKKGDPWTASQKSVRLVRDVDESATIVTIGVDLFISQGTKNSFPMTHWADKNDLVLWEPVEFKLDISKHKNKFRRKTRKPRQTLDSNDQEKVANSIFTATANSVNVRQVRTSPRERTDTWKIQENRSVPKPAPKRPKSPRGSNGDGSNSGLNNMAPLLEVMPCSEGSLPVDKQAGKTKKEYYRSIEFIFEMIFYGETASYTLRCPKVKEIEKKGEVNATWAHDAN